MFLKLLYNSNKFNRIIYSWIKNYKFENSPADGNNMYKDSSVKSRCRMCTGVVNDDWWWFCEWIVAFMEHTSKYGSIFKGGWNIPNVSVSYIANEDAQTSGRLHHCDVTKEPPIDTGEFSTADSRICCPQLNSWDKQWIRRDGFACICSQRSLPLKQSWSSACILIHNMATEVLVGQSQHFTCFWTTLVEEIIQVWFIFPRELVSHAC